MGKATPASVGINVELNSAYVDTQAKKIKTSIGGVRETADSLGKAFTTLGTAFFATEIISTIGSIGSAIKDQLIESINKGIDSIDQLNDAASHIGITTDALAAFNLAANLNGSSVETMQKSLQKMQVVLGGISSESDPAAKSLAELGLSLDQVMGASAEDRFKMIAGALQNYGDVSNRAAKGNEFFGKTGSELNEVLSLGAEGFDAAARRANELGLAINSVDANKVSEAKDALDELAMAGQGVSNQLAIAFAPLITAGAQDLLGVTLGTTNGFGMLNVKILGAVESLTYFIDVAEMGTKASTLGLSGVLQWATGYDNLGDKVRAYAADAIEASQKRAKAAADERKATQDAAASEIELGNEVKKNTPAYQSFISSLEQKAAMFGKNSTEAEIYKNNLDEINPVLADYARGLQKEIDLKEASKKASEDLAKATKDAAEESRKAKIDFEKDQKDQLKGLLDSIKTPQQKLNDEIMKLQEFMFNNPGKIDQAQYAKLLQNAHNNAGIQAQSFVLPGIKSRGSVEAENAILENNFSNRDTIWKNIEKTAKDHFTEAQSQSKKLDSMVDGLSNLAIANIA